MTFVYLPTNYRKELMSIVKKKSQENLDSAKILIDNKKYNSSVHCSYYACFQMSKYCLNNNEYEKYDEQDFYTKSSGNDSHNHISQKTNAFLKSQNRFHYLEYKECMSSLKRMRKNADYDQYDVSESEADLSYDNAIKVLNILNRYDRA